MSDKINKEYTFSGSVLLSTVIAFATSAVHVYGNKESFDDKLFLEECIRNSDEILDMFEISKKELKQFINQKLDNNEQ